MSARLALAPLLFVLAIASGAHAQSATYDFTGVVTSASDGYASIAAGTTISGTYSFDFGAADPAFAAGTVGSHYYLLETYSSGFVFSSTAMVDGFSYATGPSSLAANVSFVMGLTPVSPPINTFVGEEFTDETVKTNAKTSGMQLAATGGVPYASNGLPIFFGPSPGTDGYFATSTGEVRYDITSFSAVAAVPEPSTYAMMLVGLMILGTASLRRRRRLSERRV